jgi:adenosine kinase
MRREFGGCAGNIAYSLKLLGGEPLIMATVGDDAAPTCTASSASASIPRHVQVPDSFTAQAFITTDLDDNQITAFHPGRDELLAPQPCRRCATGVYRHRRARRPRGHAAARTEFADAGVPFIFDPGQGLPLFNGEELLNFLRWPTTARSMTTRPNCCRARPGVARRPGRPVNALIVTLGANGSEIHTGGKARHPQRQARMIGRPDRLRRRLTAPACCTASPKAWTREGGAPGLH